MRSTNIRCVARALSQRARRASSAVSAKNGQARIHDSARVPPSSALVQWMPLWTGLSARNESICAPISAA
jgi:hypothetical protein